MSTLVIRCSSLGDVVLAGAVTGALAPVLFLTKAAWAPVAARLPGVEQVLVLGRDAVPPVDRVVDLQGDLRGRWLSLGHGAPVSHVKRADLRRRLRVWFKLGAPPDRVVARYAQAAGVSVAPAPWIQVAGPRDATLLLPGAAWATKRWPAASFIALGRELPGPILVLGGPEDEVLVGKIAEGIGPGAEAICEAGFDATMAALGRGRLAIGGDTGLLHLCAAAGIPVLGLFGPTTSADGFWCHAGAVVELDLSCRPCSRHGSARCPMGDHRCMEALTPALVLDLLRGAPWAG